jgi:hypothetical protein
MNAPYAEIIFFMPSWCMVAMLGGIPAIVSLMRLLAWNSHMNKKTVEL